MTGWDRVGHDRRVQQTFFFFARLDKKEEKSIHVVDIDCIVRGTRTDIVCCWSCSKLYLA